MANPIDFPESTTIFRGDPASDVRDLPCLVTDNGITVSCWALSPGEIAQIKADGHIWVMQKNNGAPLQPQLIAAGDPFEQEIENADVA